MWPRRPLTTQLLTREQLLRFVLDPALCEASPSFGHFDEHFLSVDRASAVQSADTPPRIVGSLA